MVESCNVRVSPSENCLVMRTHDISVHTNDTCNELKRNQKGVNAATCNGFNGKQGKHEICRIKGSKNCPRNMNQVAHFQIIANNSIVRNL